MADHKAFNNRGKGYGLDEKGDLVLKAYSIRLTAADLNGASEVALDETLPEGSIVEGVYINVITPEATGATKTLDVGTLSSEAGGDADGFLDGVSVATAGLKKGTLLSSGQTLGALLRVDESGSTGFIGEPAVITAERTISVTPGSTGFVELVCDVIVKYLAYSE